MDRMEESDYSSDSSASSDYWEFSDEAPNPNKKHKCPYEGCGKSFFRPSKLEIHKKTHTGEKPFKCNISGCQKSYHSKDHLKRHQDQFHFKNIKDVVCPEEGCGLKMRQNSLQKHMLRMHNSLRKWKYKCNECSRTFKSGYELEKHSYTHYKVIKCDFCSKEFVNEVVYSRHLKRHRIYECICKQKFYVFNMYRHHKKDCEFTRPKCNICNRFFSNPTNLKQHLLKVHLGGDDIFSCPFEGCTKQYNLKGSLKNHIQSTHAEKDKDDMHYICCLCSTHLKNDVNFWKHIKYIHLNPSREPKSGKKVRSDKDIPKKPMLTVLTGIEHIEPAKSIVEKDSLKNSDIHDEKQEERCDKK